MIHFLGGTALNGKESISLGQQPFYNVSSGKSVLAFKFLRINLSPPF